MAKGKFATSCSTFNSQCIGVFLFGLVCWFFLLFATLQTPKAEPARNTLSLKNKLNQTFFSSCLIPTNHRFQQKELSPVTTIIRACIIVPVLTSLVKIQSQVRRGKTQKPGWSGSQQRLQSGFGRPQCRLPGFEVQRGVELIGSLGCPGNDKLIAALSGLGKGNQQTGDDRD